MTFLAKSRTQFDVVFDNDSVIKIGDPVILYENEVARPVGRIIEIPGGPNDHRLLVSSNQAKVEFFSSLPELRNGDYLAYHNTPESVEWMVQMMLPPKTREKISGLIMQAYRKHQTELSELLQPIIVQTIRDTTDVIKSEFKLALKTHDERIKRLGERYQSELVERELIPLIQDEIWPIVQEESTPVAREIGMEMWQQVSVWRFGWRMLYDRSPLPEKNMVEKEFQRFIDQHGAPILEARLPEMLELQQKILSRVSENKKVQKVVGDATGKVVQDSEFQHLAADILRDVFVDNDRLMAAFEENWKTKEAQSVLEITNQRLEPTITSIGQALFGDPEHSITPEFSRVLRNRILPVSYTHLTLPTKA